MRRVLATGTVLVLAVSPVVLAPGPAAAAAPAYGAASTTAAPSCWAVKQADPASRNGVYWLQTPKMVQPKQFYCDQTTDGGGWILVGRGRQGWSFTQNGQRSEADVSGTPSGTAAFAPAAVSAATVDGLLNGERVDALQDGVRIRRARDAAGTTWQEVRWRFAARKSWSWALGGQQALTSSTVGATTYTTGANTRDYAPAGTGTVDKDALRLSTNQVAAHGYQAGFAYGTTITGANDSTSHLWQRDTEGAAIPFAQMFIRPRTTSTTYPAIASSGTPATTVPARMQDRTAPTPWGVSGLMAGGTWPETTEVHALAAVGRTLYVGGRFSTVRNASGSTQVAQPYLAAFDIDTGNWISGFRPALDGMVWDIQGLPDGSIAVAGDFTSVNGVSSTAGLAALDASSGAVAPGFRAHVEDRGSGGRARVRALDLQGDWLYLGGTYTHVTGGSPAATSNLVKVARVRATDGRPDAGWNPSFNASVYELDASARGDRVYVVGLFTAVSGKAANQLAVLSTAAGAPLVEGLQPWKPTVSLDKVAYQQVVMEVGDDVWQGGAEHNFQRYRRADYALLDSHVTKRGGDFQSAVEIDGVVYASCHCNNYSYSDLNSWTSAGAPPLGSYTDVHPITYVGAWDAATGRYLPEFAPSLGARVATGPWDMTKDANNCLWFGGDMTRGTNGQWLGGFGRFCARDTTAPTTPTGLTATAGTEGNSLAWGRSTDRSSLSYEVLRDDRVVAVVPGSTTSYVDQGASASATYWVRAVDSAGNRSASTSGVAPAQAPLPVTATTTPVFTESWTAADGSPWPSAWTSSGSSGAPQVVAGRGRLGWTDASGAYARSALSDTSTQLADGEVLLSYRWSDTGAVSYFVTTLRGSGGWLNGYRPRNGYSLQLQSNSRTATLQRTVNGTTTSLGSATAQTGTTAQQWLRFRTVGDRVMVRVWADGSPEPTSWTLSLTDSAPLTQAGQPHVSHVRGGSNVGARAVDLDDLTVSAVN